MSVDDAHERSICEEDFAIAKRPVGWVGGEVSAALAATVKDWVDAPMEK